MSLDLGEFDDWTPSEKVYALMLANRIPGYPSQEIELMASTVVEFRPYWIIEWGTNRGSSARIFYETAQFIGLEVQIHTIELPPDVPYHEHPGEESGLFVRGLKQVHQHRGDGLSTALELLKHLPAHPTLIFIDGDHSPDNVRRELHAVVEAAPWACLLLHDTGHNVSGPREVLDEFLAQSPDCYTVTKVDVPGWAGITRLWPR